MNPVDRMQTPTQVMVIRDIFIGGIITRLFKHVNQEANMTKEIIECIEIVHALKEVNGYEAVRLWWKYVNDYDTDALNTLLEYNKEDVVNLRELRDRLLSQPTG